ncbi:MAG: Fe-S cluster assembly protein HesB [Actinomycetota bacterium]|nr:Fe-S cluster assembly protein HesB [Actinomycetota bacterium]
MGAGGEPVDLWRTINSHGVVDLPPMRIDADARRLEATLPVEGFPPRLVAIGGGRASSAAIQVAGPALARAEARRLLDAVRHLLRLDEDLSPFYAAAATDPELAWATRGAGRLVRSPTVFEEVVKTICTTNCAWSATERMVGALVQHLGEPATGVEPEGPYGRAFPSARAMADADLGFYADVVRAGYRGAYLRRLAESVETGAVELEALGRASRDELSDDELAARLLALPGVGPYAAAHIMMMLGRYSRLVLDSWTRPKYARLTGGRPKKDATIARRFRRYGPYAGLAFWLFLTRDWVDDEAVAGPS